MRRYIFPFIVFLIGLYLIGIRLVDWDFDRIAGDMGDGRINNYFLEHGYQYLTGKLSSYWDAPFFYPEQATISISDNLLGTLPVYAFFRLLSFDRETAYQLWFLCLLALNFFGCFIALKKLKISPEAAAVGAYLFAFSLPVAGGLFHLQMFPRFAFPIVIYSLIRFVRDKKPKHLFLFLLFTVFQMYCGIYLGLMSVIASLIVFAILVLQAGIKNEIRSFRSFIRMHGLKAGVYFTGSILLLIFLFRPYISRSAEVHRTYRDIAEGLPVLQSYFYPPAHTLFYDWLRPLGHRLHNEHEHTLFMGFASLFAIGLGIYFLIKLPAQSDEKRGWTKSIRFWLISLSLLILFTMRLHGSFSLYKIIFQIPGFQAIRAGSRIVQIELFFLAGLAATVVHLLLQRVHGRGKQVLVVSGIFLFVVLDQFVYKTGLPSFSKAESQNRIERLKAKLVKENVAAYKAFAYLPEKDIPVYIPQVDAMLVSQEIGVPTVNGYSAFSPSSHESFFTSPDTANLMHCLQVRGVDSSSVIVVSEGR